MPPKKKKVKKKKKKATGEDFPKIVNEIPTYIDPVKDAPVVKLKFLPSIPSTGYYHGFFPRFRTFNSNAIWDIPVSTTLNMVFRRIKEIHGGSIEGIRVSLYQYPDKDEAFTNPSLTLRDIGITEP